MQNDCNTYPKIFIFIALDCEAKPVVSFYDLKKETVEHPFSIFKNNEIVLTITGIGKVAMAGAVAYTFALFPDNKVPVIVNIGIAGHRTHALGHLLLAMKIVDNDSGKKFYPQLLGINKPETSEILTASAPCAEYRENCLVDMEASAFYEMAIKFSTCELIHSFKVVSDNADFTIDTIQPKVVSQWIANQLTEIDKLIKHWVEFRKLVAGIELEEYQELVNKWHFTVSGKIKLKALLMRWKILSAGDRLTLSEERFANAKELLKKLEADVNRLEVYL